MAPRMQVARYSDFTGGLNLRDDPSQLAPNELSDCLNMRPMPQGGMRQRKTAVALNTGAADFPAAPPSNIWTFYGNGVQQVVVQEGWDARYSTGGAAFTAINPDALTLTGLMRAATMARITVGSSERLYVQRNTEAVPWYWTGAAAGVLVDPAPPAGPTAWNDNLAAPAGGKMPRAKYLTTHNGFMFLANTKEYNGVADQVFPNRVRWSHPGQPEDYRTNDYIDVGVDDGDLIQGIASLGESLYIFKERSVWRLTGYSATSFQLQKLYTGLGAVSQEAICVAPSGIFFFDRLKGVHHIQPNGRVTWLWEKLYCRLQDNTIPATHVDTVVLSWADGRLFCAVPWLSYAYPTRHFIFDPQCGKGAWYMNNYLYLSGGTPSIAEYKLGPMVEFRPTNQVPLILCCMDRAVLGVPTTGIVAKLDVDETSHDRLFLPLGGGWVGFESWFTTAPFDAGTPGVKKQIRRPFILVNSVHNTIMSAWTYVNYKGTVAKSSRIISVPGTPAVGSTWGSSTWGLSQWGLTPIDDQAIVRGPTVGAVYAVAFKLGASYGQFIAVNNIELHYTPRRPA